MTNLSKVSAAVVLATSGFFVGSYTATDTVINPTTVETVFVDRIDTIVSDAPAPLPKVIYKTKTVKDTVKQVDTLVQVRTVEIPVYEIIDNPTTVVLDTAYDVIINMLIQGEVLEKNYIPLNRY